MLDKEKTAEEISDILGLEPLALEGGMWAQTLKDKNSTAIYYLLSKNNFSAMHKLEASAALVAGEVSADVFEVAAGAASLQTKTAQPAAEAAKEKQQQRMVVMVATAEAALAEAKDAGDTEAVAEAERALNEARVQSAALTASSLSASESAESPKLTSTFTTIATALEAQKQQIKLLASEKMHEEMMDSL